MARLTSSDSNGLGPTVCGKSESPNGVERPLTGKCGSYENGCEATDSANKWCIANKPIMATNVAIVGISATVDCNPKNDENLFKGLCTSACKDQRLMCYSR